MNNEFRCSSTFKQEVFNFADLALRHPFTRALEDGVSRYAVQRRRRAARADLEVLFDDLALNLGWKEQRLASARALYTGVVRAQGRKIIFSTNLPNAGDLDDALLRPDRCFAHMIARPLLRAESRRLLAALCAGDEQKYAQALDATVQNGKARTIADIYKAFSQVREGARV